MGLSSIPIKGIDIAKAGRQLRQPAYHEDSPIHAFDFETTENGKIYLLSYQFDGEPPKHTGNSDFFPLHSKLLFKILVHRKTRQPAVNVWYNLDFDVNALFGTILTENQMEELADTNTTNITVNNVDYELTYINGKFLSITDEHKHTSTHYDISQFFGGGLNQAGKNWLGITKDDIDPTKAQEYDWQTVTSYAEQDAYITRQLWDKFVELGEGTLNIPLGKPISTGFIAQHTCFKELDSKPSWGSSQFQELARKAYHGGRFEVYRRGYFSDVIGLDINSAYPYHMTRLPDLGTCEIHVGGASLDDIRQANWGYVTLDVTTNPSRNIQPFAIKERKVMYPSLDDYRLTTTIHEFLFALDNGYIEDFTIRKVGLVYENSSTVYPFEWLQEWYEDRNTYKDKRQKKNDKYDFFQFILKVIMNSVYGKTCQVTEKYEFLDDKAEFNTNRHEFTTEGHTGKPLKGWYEAGDLFNPFYAGYITALTRLQLHEKALSLGKEDDTIMFATDCLMLEADNLDRNKIDKFINPKELGAWDFEYKGNAFVVGSGVYDVYQDDSLQKIAMRGFKEITKTYDSWRHAAHEANGKIELKNERPARYKEWLTHNGQRPRPAEFFEDSRTLEPDFDDKRAWEKEASFELLLEDNHGSNPIKVSNI